MSEIDILKFVKNYGTHHVRMQSFNELYVPSDEVVTTYTITGPTIALEELSKIKIIRDLKGIEQFEVLVDGEVIATIDYDGTEEWRYDLSVHDDLPEGKRIVNLRSIGDGVNPNLSNSLTYYAGHAPIYGISGLATTIPTLTRTDDSIGMGFEINTENGEIRSDFNNEFPWSECQIVEDEAGKFIKFPEMWFRVGVNSSYQITDIAVSPTYGLGDNWYKVDPFMYACYGASYENDKLWSLSGKTRQASVTKSQFRTYAKNIGEDYHLLDLYHYTVLVFLFWIEFATTDSRSIMTGRYSYSGTNGGQSKINTGYTDNLNTPSGYELSYRQMRYHYIEDFVGNIMEFVEGCYLYGYGSKNYVTSNPEHFSESTTNMQQLCYSNPNSSYSYPTISSIGWDANHPFMVLPITHISNSSYNTYFCQRDNGIGNQFLVVGQCYSYSLNNGGVYSLRRLSNTTSSTVGARLIKIVNQ